MRPARLPAACGVTPTPGPIARKQPVSTAAQLPGMSKHPVAGPPPPWAEVRAHDHVVRYRRSGSGPLVLLLGLDEGRAPWAEFEAALGRGHRLVVPRVLGDAHEEYEARLGAFLEGLGADAVTAIVVHQGLVAPTIALALRGAGVIRRVVVIADGLAERMPVAAAIGVGTGVPILPLLLVDRQGPADEALPAILRFVTDARD